MTNQTSFYRKLKAFNQRKFCKKVSLKRFKINHPYYWVNGDTTYPFLKEVNEESYYLQEIPGVFENRKNLEMVISPYALILPIGCGIPFPTSLSEEYIFPEEHLDVPLLAVEIVSPNLLLHRRMLLLSGSDFDIHFINYEHIINLTNSGQNE